MLLHVFLNHLNFSLQILLGVLAPLFSKNAVIQSLKSSTGVLNFDIKTLKHEIAPSK